MKKIMLLICLSVGIFANTQPYKKDIVLEELNETMLVQVSLDNAFYQHTSKNYSDVRLHSTKGVEGYFIAPYYQKYFLNQQSLKANLYDRKNATLTYLFKEPFEIEEIKLHIEDRNFESSVDVYVDDVLVLEDGKIFDYSNETGGRNFTLKIEKVKAKKVTIVYHLDQTTSFYKKYKDLKELSQYLTIKSATFSNHMKAHSVFEHSVIMLHSNKTKKKVSSYLFKTKNIPFSEIELNIAEKNFKRSGELYSSEDGEKWRYHKSFTLESSTITGRSDTRIHFKIRTPYLMLKLHNQDNKALNIKSIKLFTVPNYLYFLADKGEKYTLYFGDKNLTTPSYELKSLVNRDSLSVKATLSKIEHLKVNVIKNNYLFFEENKKTLFIFVIFLSISVMAYIAFGLLKKEEN